MRVKHWCIWITCCLLAGCGSDKPTGPEAPATSIRGRATVQGGTDHSGILVLLQKTSSGAPADLWTSLRQAQQGPVGFAVQDSAFTGADGSYRFSSVEPGTYTIYGLKENTRRGFIAGVIASEGKETVAPDFVLEPTGAIKGIVRLDGQGDHSGSVVFVAGTSYAAFTDKDGSYLITEVPNGTRSILATHWGYDVQQKTGVTVAQGDTADAGTLTLHPAPAGAPQVVMFYPPDSQTVRIPGRPEVIPGGAWTYGERGLTLFLQFSQPMNWEVVKGALSMEPAFDYQFYPSGSDQLLLIAATDSTLSGGRHPLRLETEYVVTLGTGAAGIYGDTLQKPFQLHFTTGGFEVASVMPTQGDSIVPPRVSELQIRTNARFAIDDYQDRSLVRITPVVSGDWSSGYDYLRYSFGGPLRVSTRYELTVSDKLHDTRGHKLAAPYTWSFTTEPLLISSTVPGGTGFWPSSSIPIQFNTYMDQAATEGAVSFQSSGGPDLPLAFNWNLYYGDYGVNVCPARGSWPAGKTITLTVGTEASDTYGAHPEAPYTLQFTTALPQVVWTAPSDGDTGYAPRENVRISFNTAMDPQTTLPAIQAEGAGAGPIPLQISLYGSAAEIMPQRGIWPSGERITITVGIGATDLDGVALAQAHSFSFVTASAGIESTYPSDGTTDFPASQWVNISFNTNMAPGVTINAISARAESIPAIPVTTWGDGSWYTIQPEGGYWPSGQRVTVTVSEVAADLWGNQLPGPASFSFTVEPFRVTGTYPQDQGTGYPHDQVYIYFSGVLDPASCAAIGAATPDRASIPLQCYIGGNNASILPEGGAAWPSHVPITVTVGTGAKDQSGSNLAEPYSFSFTVPYDSLRAAR